MSLYLPERTIRDHPSNWESRFYSLPLGFGPDQVRAYQKRINEITGLSHGGHPILRLDWGGNTSETIFIDWDEFGNPTKTQDVPKYHFERINPKTGFSDMIPIKRWIISERGEPEQYRADVDDDLKFEEDGVKKLRREKPRDGYYRPLIIIGDHSKCPANCSDRKMCYGDYADPSDAYLDWIRNAVAWLEKERDLDPRKELDPEKTAQTVSRINKAARELASAKKQAYVDDFAKDYFRTHGHRFSQDRESHGPWGMLGRYDIKPKNVRKEDGNE